MNRKNIINLITAFIALLTPVLAFAVTQDEMEQARTIAAKAYIRYVNDGSGYLDDLHPKTIEELQKNLKAKEKENIKVFLDIAVPSDYQSWDKQKLIDYWAGAVFQTKGLVEKGRGGRILARKEINKMAIADPKAIKTEETPVKTEEKTAENIQPAESQASGTLQDMIADEGAIAEDLEAEDEDINIPEAYNYTWVYIMILAILVAIVIALVVYATNVMKDKGGATNGKNHTDHESHREKEEQLESLLSDKDFEINMLKKKLDAANRQTNDLKSRIEVLSNEIASLKASQAMTTVSNQRATEPPAASVTNKNLTLRTIYLGRANAKHIFVRADRNLNPGNSVYVLDTSDGYTGSFKVVDAISAWDLALSNPEEYLMNACTGADLADTRGASRIINEMPGTAIFEGGCWKVIRKAKIRYE